MSRLSKIILSVLVMVFIVFGGFLYKLRPQYVGKVQDMPLKDTTTVYFDAYGVPHIYANDAHDAYVALGYVHAQERLFQMELMKRVGAGRLSEVIGSETLKADLLFRQLGIAQKARFTADRLATESQDSDWYRATTAYLQGVNQFIDEGPTPLEFRVLGIEKEHFTVYDLHLIAGYMSFSFGQALTVDPLMTYLRDELGPEYMADLHTTYEQGSKLIPTFDLDSTFRSPSLAPFERREEGEEVDDQDFSEVLKGIGLPLMYGSNSWVIAPQNTENGSVLFANDTHIQYSQPCSWYEAHLEYPGYSFYGNHLAGIPFGLIGHSREMAWGVTMFLNDDMDLYCERLSPDGKSYLYNGEYRALTERTETIVRKGAEDTTIVVKHTHHGPIVTSSLKNLSPGDEISCQWTYLDLETDLLEAFYRLGHSTSMAEAKAGVSLIAAPGLNISYGDIEGNIAVWSAARLAERPDHTDPLYVLDGHTGDDEILGYRPFSDNPHVENPPWGYVYSANNLHEPVGEKPYPGYYEPDNRAARLDQKLAARTDWTMEAMKKLITDTYSIDDKRLGKDLVQLVGKPVQDPLTEVETDALRQIKEWDGEHRMDDIGPAVLDRWVYHILAGAMSDELGRQRFEQVLNTNIIKSSVKELVCNQESVWWDDVTTEDEIETRSDILRRSLRLTVEEMEGVFGDEAEAWSWGRWHQTIHPHMFKDVPILGSALSVGPFPAPGGVETVNNAYFRLNADDVAYSHHGPQMRILIDFDDVERSESILPTGQSGVFMSPHYDDQAEMYIRGAFRPQLMDRDDIVDESSRLLLIPAQ